MEGWSILSQDTLIPISLVITFIGGVAWLTAMYSRVGTNANRIRDMEIDITKMREKHSIIEDRLARIETKLDIVINNINK